MTWFCEVLCARLWVDVFQLAGNRLLVELLDLAGSARGSSRMVEQKIMNRNLFDKADHASSSRTTLCRCCFARCSKRCCSHCAKKFQVGLCKPAHVNANARSQTRTLARTHVKFCSCALAASPNVLGPVCARPSKTR